MSFIDEFIEAVYLERTELCKTMNTEETCIKDATDLIKAQKEEIFALRQIIEWIVESAEEVSPGEFECFSGEARHVLTEKEYKLVQAILLG